MLYFVREGKAEEHLFSVLFPYNSRLFQCSFLDVAMRFTLDKIHSTYSMFNSILFSYNLVLKLKNLYFSVYNVSLWGFPPPSRISPTYVY